MKQFLAMLLFSVSASALAATPESGDTTVSSSEADSPRPTTMKDNPLKKLPGGNPALYVEQGTPASNGPVVFQDQNTPSANGACQEGEGAGLSSATSLASGTDCSGFPHCNGPLGSCCVVLGTIPNLGTIWACFITNDQGTPLFAVAGGICAP